MRTWGGPFWRFAIIPWYRWWPGLRWGRCRWGVSEWIELITPAGSFTCPLESRIANALTHKAHTGRPNKYIQTGMPGNGIWPERWRKNSFTLASCTSERHRDLCESFHGVLNKILFVIAKSGKQTPIFVFHFPFLWLSRDSAQCLRLSLETREQTWIPTFEYPMEISHRLPWAPVRTREILDVFQPSERA